MRTDKLREHYFSKVIWEKDGKPVPTYSDSYCFCNSTERQQHTEYFHQHTFTKTKLPPLRHFSHAPKNPFEACKKKPDPDCIDFIENVSDIVWENLVFPKIFYFSSMGNPQGVGVGAGQIKFSCIKKQGGNKDFKLWGGRIRVSGQNIYG